MICESKIFKGWKDPCIGKVIGFNRKFVAYYYFISWWHWSLGFHFYPVSPNIEIHLPFGFIRIGWLTKNHLS